MAGKYIPRTKYIDGIAEVSFIPIDEFFIGVFTFLASLWFGLSLLCFPLAVGVVLIYRRSKRNKKKNFYLTIPYRMGFKKPNGVPSIVARYFVE